MNTRILLHSAAGCMVSALGGAPASADTGTSWTANGAPPRIHDEALAQKFGEVCNKQFALP